MTDSSVVGIDVGGTKTKMAFLDGDELRVFFHEPTPQAPDAALQMLVNGIEDANLPSPVEAVGIGCPGPLDQGTGVVHSPPNLPQWDNFAIRDLLAEELGASVELENDANCGALGEAVHGAARDYDRVFYMTISTGLGTGIVFDGEVYQGAFGLAGDIWAYDPASLADTPAGNNLTELASGNGLIHQVERAIGNGRRTSIPTNDISTRTILAAFESGDELATEIIETARHTLAGTICFVLHLLAPDIVTLAGGLCTDPKWLVDPVTRLVREKVGIDKLKEIPIQRAELWEDAVLYGALSLF